jgi:glycosyltransferase involved in cell wall biosynthesis
VESVFFDAGEAINFDKTFDVVILVKACTRFDCEQAWAAHHQGIPVVFDLCDNIFINPTDFPELSPDIFLNKEEFLKHFRAILPCLKAITTSSEALAQKVRKETNNQVPVCVIPDSIETTDFLETIQGFNFSRKLNWLFGNGLVWFLGRGMPQLFKSLCKKIVVSQIKLFRKIRAESLVLPKRSSHSSRYRASAHQKRKDLPQVLWFGNSGLPGLFGLSDLLLIKEPLERAFKKKPFQLKIVSDNGRASQIIQDQIAVPSEFMGWSNASAIREIKASALCLVPNSCNEFTISKSANRSVLSFYWGTPVVATRTEALAPFEGVIPFDQWEESIVKWLSDPPERARVVRMGQAVIGNHFSGQQIVSKWLRIIEQIRAATN